MDTKKFLNTKAFANLCHTSKDTIIFYDRENILKPYYVDEKGYRFYLPGQYYDFMRIHSLKTLGVNLKDINSITLENMPEYIDELTNLKNILEEKLDELLFTHRYLNNEIEFANSINKHGFHEPFLKQCEEEYLLVEKVNSYFDYDIESDMINRHYQMRKISSDLAFNGVYKFEDMMNGNFNNFYFGQKVIKKEPGLNIITKPKGLYLTINGYAPWNKFEENVLMIKNGLEKLGVKPCGDVYFYTPKTHIRDEGSFYNEISVQVEQK